MDFSGHVINDDFRTEIQTLWVPYESKNVQKLQIHP